MGIIDEKGKFFGKINAFDFIVIVALLSCLKIVPYLRLMARSPHPSEEPRTYFTVDRRCPICGWTITLKFPLGTLVPLYYETEEGSPCPSCRNRVVLIDDRPKPQGDKLKSQRDNLLKEHPRLRKYFE